MFPFAYNDDDEPMYFEIEFKDKGVHLIYGFKVLSKLFKRGPRKIVSENLSVVVGKSKTVKLFERSNNRISIMKNKKALSFIKLNEKLLAELEERINSNLDKSELFLTGAFKSIISNEFAESVLGFFRNNLFVVSDFTLKKTNVTIPNENISRENFFAWNRMLDGFVKNADFGPQSIFFEASKADKDDASKLELVSLYKNKSKGMVIPADLMESRGTLKLLDFAIHFQTLFAHGGVFVLDEFDAAIHPELIKGIIALFHNQTVNVNGAQLVFTTHNPIYLNNKMFRRDQIKFVEKDKDTFDSVLYSLADFGSIDVRNDQNYLINYFKGRYGALPFIDFSKLLVEYETKEEEYPNLRPTTKRK